MAGAAQLVVGWNDGDALMTTVQFEDANGDVDAQSLACFRRLRDFIHGMNRRIDSSPHLIVEVSRRDIVPSVMRARSMVFGDRRPHVVSHRIALLPNGEFVRLTLTLD